MQSANANATIAIFRATSRANHRSLKAAIARSGEAVSTSDLK
jgi:hypothetical protein